MKHSFIVSIDSWGNGDPTPAKDAFGKIPEVEYFELGGNTSPSIAWAGAPQSRCAGPLKSLRTFGLRATVVPS